MAGIKSSSATDDGRCVDGHAMTSTAGSSRENNAVKKTPEAGPSGGIELTVTPKERPNPPGGFTAGSKRLLSTADPDYDHQPDTKRLREMQLRAQDELSQRVIKVVDRELHNAIMEKDAELEEIDGRILRLQQCLHTLRYCVSLSYYSVNKGEAQKGEGRGSRLLGLHPAIQGHLGKAPARPLPTAEALSTGPHTSEHKSLSPATAEEGEKRLSYQSQCTSNHPGGVTCPTSPLTANSKATAGRHSLGSTSLPPPTSQASDKVSEKSPVGHDKVSQSPRLPSPKHLPPRPPDNPSTIPQGRQRRFQSKRRLIVGNTYQYLTPLPGEEAVDSFRYKWQVYVRAPPGDPDTATFLQSVTFVLDQSYSPHHVITLKQPPFVLSRRGWGEFKIQLMLKFTDPRNKPARLLHPLVLSRPNDALALTGLWRLGQENWYDLWVYMPHPEGSSDADEGAQDKEDEEESCPASLTQELLTGVIVSKVEEHTTVDHEPTKNYKGSSSSWAAPENTSKDQSIEERDGVTRIKVECVSTFEKSTVSGGTRTNIECVGLSPAKSGIDVSAKDVSTSEKSTTLGSPRTNIEHVGLLGTKGGANVTAVCVSTSQEGKEGGGGVDKGKSNEKGEGVARKSNTANGKVCRVHVRQADGSLKPYLIPSHLYPLALQAARNYTKQNKANTLATANTDHTQEAKVVQRSVTQGLSAVLKGNKIQLLKDAGKPVTLKLIPQHSTSSPSGVGGVSARTSSLLKGTSHLLKAKVTQHNLVENQTVATTSRASPQNLLGVKKQALLRGQRHATTNTLKQATASENHLHLSQVQRLSSQTSSFTVTNAKNVSETPVTGHTKVVGLNQIQAGNVRFVTSDGQLLTPEKLKSLGLQVLMNAGQSRIVTSLGPHTTTTTTTATSAISTTAVTTTTAATTTTTTTTTTGSTGALLIQGGRVVGGANILQLVTSQGKMAVKQLSPVKLQGEKVSNIVPLQQLVVCSSSNSGSSHSILGMPGKLVVAPQRTIKVEGEGEGKILKGSVSPSLMKFISGASVKAGGGGGSGGSLNMKKFLLGAKIKEHQQQQQQQEEQEKECSTYWEDYLGRVCEACSTGLSTSSCVSAWLRVLPLVQPSHTPPPPFSFCRAVSHKHFLSWPLAKQRACEFQRAREVRWWLQECRVKGWEGWTVPRLVAWARGHAHTPVTRRPVIHTDKVKLPPSTPTSGNSLSYIGDLQKLEEEEHQSDTTTCPSDTLEVDVVGLDEEEDTLEGPKRKLGSPVKQRLEYLPFEEEEVSSGCEWVGQLVSQLRLSLQPQEVGEGHAADVARATLWKAALNLMEDLLRASHFQAWQESSVVPPPTITPTHVLSALTHSRPEYDVLTDLGLGTPSESV